MMAKTKRETIKLLLNKWSESKDTMTVTGIEFAKYPIIEDDLRQNFPLWFGQICQNVIKPGKI